MNISFRQFKETVRRLSFRRLKEDAKKIKEKFLEFGKREPVGLAVLAGYILDAALILYYIPAFVYAFHWLDARVFPLSSFFSCFLMIFNLALFVCSTMYQELNFYHTKKALFVVNYVTICLNLLSLLFHYTGVFIFPRVIAIKVTPFVSANLIVNFARYLEFLICGSAAYGMGRLLFLLFRNNVLMGNLLRWRLSQVVDFRKNREYLYDLHLGRNRDTRQKIYVYENDRYLHVADNGVSSTGKSSMMMLNGICGDLDTRLRNEQQQKRLIKQMLNKKSVYRAVSSDAFWIQDYHPYPSTKEEYEELFLKTYRAAGQTILAPDDSMLDKVYELAKARGFSCNRIDPTILPDGTYKEGFIGYNPFYIDPKLQQAQDKNYAIAVNDRASIYKEVMKQLYLLDGNAGDAYFTGVNETTNYSVTLLCILTYPFLKGRQANPEDSLDVMCRIRPEEAEDVALTEDKNGNTRSRKVKVLRPSATLTELLNIYETKCSAAIHEEFNMSIGMFFYQNFVNNPADGVNLYTQALGLRNLVSSFVLDPRIRPILTAPDDHTIDIARTLERGEITLVNFYQKLGASLSRVFGLFYLLNFDIEVKKRPGEEETRNPHFLRIDELPVILHPIIQDQISQYRKYRVSCEYAFQSLSQMNETKETRFLAEELLKCGTQVLFGRAMLKEMEIYSKLSGTRKERTTQTSYSEGSIWLDSGITQQVRESETEEAVVSESDIRYLNFGEATVFLTREGVACTPVVSKFKWVSGDAYKDQTEGNPYFSPELYPVLPDNPQEDFLDIFEEDTSVTYGTVDVRPGTEPVPEGGKSDGPAGQPEGPKFGGLG